MMTTNMKDEQRQELAKNNFYPLLCEGVNADELVELIGESELLTEHAENYVPTSDFDELDESERENTEQIRPDEWGHDNGEYPEILQWYFVTTRGYAWLKAAGEVVARKAGGNTLWGRTCAGQSVTLDYVAQSIALAMDWREQQNRPWDHSEREALEAVGYWS